MPFRLTALTLALALAGCKSPGTPEASLKDTGIVTTAIRDQRGAAFCWSYALVAHIEQRYYELTRGPKSGGFRLNLSEEYLGLIHLTKQLIKGQPVDEGLKLSETLALIEEYGLVPERIGDKTLFRAAFDMPLARDVVDRANADWSELGLAEGDPLPAAVALKAVADVAQLTAEQHAFVAAAMGITDAAGAQFRFANRDYSPKTFVRERLKFSASDYAVLEFPDSGRGADGNGAFSPAYLSVLGAIKKAMLYGYSVPISFNFVTESAAANGALTCLKRHCSDADIGLSTPDWPHANHAVLLIDFRTDGGSFAPVTAASLAGSMATVPSDWVFKNSWGFNHNTSSDPELLKRFPLPAYTMMTQDFFEASHWLRPGRFEAIVPRQVCLKELTKERRVACTPLVVGPGQIDLGVDAPLLLGNLNQAALARDPVEYDADAKELTDDQILKVDLDISAGEVCARLEVAADVKYVAVFVTPTGKATETLPRLVLSADSQWRHCHKTAEGPKTFGLVFEPLNDRYKALGQLKRAVIVPE